MGLGNEPALGTDTPLGEFLKGQPLCVVLAFLG